MDEVCEIRPSAGSNGRQLQQMDQRFVDGGADVLETDRPAHPIKDGSDDFHFVISQSRRLDATQCGRDLRFGRGDATLMRRCDTPGGARRAGSSKHSEGCRGFSDWRARHSAGSRKSGRRQWSYFFNSGHSLASSGLAASSADIVAISL
jgi:hypothetical protein